MLVPPRAFPMFRQAACGALVALATAAHAEQWRFEPTLGVEETLTNNVNLDPNATRQCN